MQFRRKVQKWVYILCYQCSSWYRDGLDVRFTTETGKQASYNDHRIRKKHAATTAAATELRIQRVGDNSRRVERLRDNHYGEAEPCTYRSNTQCLDLDCRETLHEWKNWQFSKRLWNIDETCSGTWHLKRTPARFLHHCMVTSMSSNCNGSCAN